MFVDTSVKKKKKRIPKRDAERIAFVVRRLAFNPYAGGIYVYKLKRRTSSTYK